MFKKVNLIIIAFFSALTVLFEIGFVIYLPLVIFYSLRDSRNIYYFAISGLISIALFGQAYLFIYIALIIILILFQFLVHKLPSGYYIYAVLVLFNIITQVALGKQELMLTINENPWHIIILNIISLALYFYFEHNLLEALKSKRTLNLLYDNSYLEIIVVLIAILGATHIKIDNFHVSLLLAFFYAMYFATSSKDIYAMLYSLITMFVLLFGFNIPEAIFLPFICAIYFLPFVFPMLILNIFLTCVIFANTTYQDIYMLSIMGTSVIFELLKSFIAKEKTVENVFFENVHEQVTNQLNHEILAFSAFLDRFSEGIVTPKEYNDRISDGIKTLVQNHCINCENKKTCYATHKSNIYFYFRNILLQKDLNHVDYLAFSKNCPYIREIEYTGRSLNKRIDFSKTSSNNNSLVAQIQGISAAIKQYAIDLSSKEEVNYRQFAEFKQRLINYGYTITYFEIKRTFVKDFLIILGVKTTPDNFEEVQKTVRIIGEKVLDSGVSVLYEKEERNTIYLKVIPEILVDVIYGYGAISSDGNQINGDNYLIKELNNGRFISAISDGMGKGYSAFYESNMTLQLVDDVIGLDIDSTTALEILNTFHVIQDYLERYATLDLLEINRYKFTARFYKMGASTSYILRDNGKIEKIINKSLPFGIDEGIEECEYTLANNDVIIMSSDGVFENIIDEQSLESLLLRIKDLSPQKIVYELINFTINNNVKSSDDMTIIALKIKQA